MIGKKVLIVNDSSVVTAVIKAVVATVPGLRVVATAVNGVQAVNILTQYLPDLILMDIHMPEMNGVEATRRIMQARPKTRILITSATINKNMRYIFDALQYGALDYVHSPSLSCKPGTVVDERQLSHAGSKLLAKIKTVLHINDQKVIDKTKRIKKITTVQLKKPAVISAKQGAGLQMLAIGCSTGGPTTVAILLSRLKYPFPAPVLVCLHIDRGFTAGFVNWLAETTGLPVFVAKNRTIPEPGNVYIAPGGRNNLEISTSGRMMITKSKPNQTFLPNINHLFYSMAQNTGAGSCGAVLTGMGNDGADGLAAIKKAGGIIFAQDEKSAVVDDMPHAAREVTKNNSGYTPGKMAQKINETF